MLCAIHNIVLNHHRTTDYHNVIQQAANNEDRENGSGCGTSD